MKARKIYKNKLLLSVFRSVPVHYRMQASLHSGLAESSRFAPKGEAAGMQPTLPTPPHKETKSTDFVDTMV